MTLKPGAAAPPIEAVNHEGLPVRPDLSQPTVLYFYPKDDTPGCTIEACGFRDSLAAFEQLGAQVFGVSTDDAASHRAFAKKYDLNFSLLCDPEKTLARAYGVLGEHGYANRVTFLIKDGQVQQVFDPVNPTGHSEAVAQALRALLEPT